MLIPPPPATFGSLFWKKRFCHLLKFKQLLNGEELQKVLFFTWISKSEYYSKILRKWQVIVFFWKEAINGCRTLPVVYCSWYHGDASKRAKEKLFVCCSIWHMIYIPDESIYDIAFIDQKDSRTQFAFIQQNACKYFYPSSIHLPPSHPTPFPMFLCRASSRKKQSIKASHWLWPWHFSLSSTHKEHENLSYPHTAHWLILLLIIQWLEHKREKEQKNTMRNTNSRRTTIFITLPKHQYY